MLEELEQKVIAWAEEKGIFDNSTTLDQIGKTQEELTETRDALVEFPYTFDDVPIRDGIGDVLVTLIILSRMCTMSLEECLQYAYDEIKDRKGKMVDGLFVKDDREE